jgi:hypothetical protein
MSVRVLSKKEVKKTLSSLGNSSLDIYNVEDRSVEKKRITQGQYRIDGAFDNLRVSPGLSGNREEPLQIDLHGSAFKKVSSYVSLY